MVKRNYTLCRTKRKDVIAYSEPMLESKYRFRRSKERVDLEAYRIFYGNRNFWVEVEILKKAAYILYKDVEFGLEEQEKFDRMVKEHERRLVEYERRQTVPLKPNKSPYGAVKYKGHEYNINVIDHANRTPIFESADWEVVDIIEFTSSFSFDETEWKFFEFLKAMDFSENPMSQSIYGGTGRVNVPKLHHGSLDKRVGGLSFFSGIVSGIPQLYNRFYVKFVFQKEPNNNTRRVTIQAGTDDAIKMNAVFANDTPFYASYSDLISGIKPDNKDMYTENVQKNAKNMYEKKSGNKATDGTYDFLITIDARHNQKYSSYLWVNADGILMETAKIYSNTEFLLVKKHGLLNLGVDELYELTFDTTLQASEGIQKQFEKILTHK